jgi:hypothetical protein
MTRIKNEKKDSLLRWLPVISFIVIAIIFRIYRTSTENHYLLAGSDGPYLPIQVKSMFEHYRLAFSDMPLLFTLCTILAKFLYLLHIGTENECILLSVRFIDTFLPPLSAIPVFLIATELKTESIKLKFSTYLMVAFAILNFTPLFIFSHQLQKNGLAIFWIFFYLYYILKIIKYENKKDILKAIVILILCALTHLGSFGLLIFISCLILIFWFVYQKEKIKSTSLKKLLLVGAVLISALVLVAIFDYTRFLRIINIPFKIFEAPVILFALNGQNFLLHGQILIILVLTNLLAIQGIILILRHRSDMDKYKIIIGLSFATSSMFLANPFLGLEWANRLFMMAYIPLTVLYLILFSAISTRWIRIPTAFTFVFLLAVSFGSALFSKPLISISKEAFAEFQQINNKFIFKRNDAIVSRQDLRLLANWAFQTKGVTDYLLTKNEFDKYNAVYFIRQIKGTNPLVREIRIPIPSNYSNIFTGDYFEIYKINDNTNLPIETQKIFKGVKGTIIEILNKKILVKDYKTNKIRTVFTNNIGANILNIHNGMKVEINGEWIPFSLSLNAETIKEIESFD